MNWHLEMELHHGKVEWDILREGFLMTFSFEGRFDNIDEVPLEVKAMILQILQDPSELVQLDWSTQLCHLLEHYNMNYEGEDDDPWNINILETKGCCQIEGPQIENLDITTPLKTRKVNISTEAKPKFAKIEDYWDDAIVDKVYELLCEYQDLFPPKFLDLKGIIGDLGVIKITLKPDMKPIKQRPYHLIPNTRKLSSWNWTRCLRQILLNQWRNLIGRDKDLYGSKKA